MGLKCEIQYKTRFQIFIYLYSYFLTVIQRTKKNENNLKYLTRKFKINRFMIDTFFTNFFI